MNTQNVRDIVIIVAVLAVSIVGIWAMSGKPGTTAQTQPVTKPAAEQFPDHPKARDFIEWGQKCGKGAADPSQCAVVETKYQRRVTACRARITPRDMVGAFATNVGDSPAAVLEWCEQHYPDLD